MSFPDIAISLRSSHIKATLLAKGISCRNKDFCSQVAARLTTVHFAHLEGQIGIPPVLIRCSGTPWIIILNRGSCTTYEIAPSFRPSESGERIGNDRGESGGRSRRNIYVREPADPRISWCRPPRSLSAKFMARIKRANNIGWIFSLFWC